MSRLLRKLDNTTKVLSLDEKILPNKYRFSIILKDDVDGQILKNAIRKTLETYHGYKVKMKAGFFWYYFETNHNDLVVEENKKIYRKNRFQNSNDYLFKISYFNKRINLDILHILTDGLGAVSFLKEIIYNYINIKYNLKRDNL